MGFRFLTFEKKKSFKCQCTFQIVMRFFNLSTPGFNSIEVIIFYIIFGNIKVVHVVVSRFPVSLSAWSFTICPTSYNRK